MSKEQVNSALIWFTTNLRTRDNSVLWEALNTQKRCIAVYCLDTECLQLQELGFPKMSPFRLQFLLESLEDLASQLAELGIPFSILVGNPEKLLPEFIKSNGIKRVYLQKDWTWEERRTVEQTKAKCSNAIEWREMYDQFLIHPDDLPFEFQKLPFIFTEFRKLVEKTLKIRPEQSNLLNQGKKVNRAKVPTLKQLGLENPQGEDRPSAFPFQGGSSAAYERLTHYFWKSNAIQSYKETRNGLIGLDYSSKFSPWLANGSISARTIYHELKNYEWERSENPSTYWLFFELLWRDFFKYVSLKYGDKIFHSNGIRSKNKRWEKDRKKFIEWREGSTASDFVNANMRELNSTGWMSNRGRQNVASYLTKTLGVDWRWGATYFESMLIDYDVHSNYGNWMYVAGVGNDPIDRIFNVEKQAQQYDPDKEYQNLWLGINQTS